MRYSLLIITCLLANVHLLLALSTPSDLQSRARSYISSTQKIAFQENKGQVTDVNGGLAPYVLFKTETQGMNVWVTNTGLTYQFLKIKEEEKQGEDEKIVSTEWQRVDMVLKDANILKENIVAESKVKQGQEHFYYPHCKKGIRGVERLNKLTIQNVYPGIDWVLYTNNKVNENSLKQDFIVHPGADPNQLKLIYEGSGTFNVSSENIHFKNAIGELTESNLYCYQGNDEINSSYAVQTNSLLQNEGAGNLLGNNVAVKEGELFSYEVNVNLGAYDKNQTLVIDPQLTWATFYGGIHNDGPMGIDTDAAGNVYISGYTYSTNFPLLNQAGSYYLGTHQGGNGDLLIVKFNNNGVRQWATYYGGSGDDVAWSLAVDANDNLWITGRTLSNNFPLQNLAGAYNQVTPGGGYDGFMLKFDPAGQVLWCTYYGGSGSDYGNSISIDNNNDVYITGQTSSNDLPMQAMAGAYNQPVFGGGNFINDAFVLKFTNNGQRLWATYYGGSDHDYGYYICNDATGNIFITGKTESQNFPAWNPGGGVYTQPYAGGEDAFVVKFDAAGARQWATYYGGSGDEYGNAIEVDNNGLIYLVGETESNNLPTQNLAGAYNQPNLGGVKDIFTVRFSNVGVHQWGSYFGGPNEELFISGARDNIAIDTCNNVYFGFNTKGTGTPTQNDASCPTNFYDGTFNGEEDCFFVKLDDQAALVWGTYFGGDAKDFTNLFTIDLNGNIFVSGEWAGYAPTFPIDETTYPTTDPGGGAYYETTHGGIDDGFMAKFEPSLSATVTTTPNTNCTICNGTATVSLTCGSPNYSYTWSNGSQTLNDTSSSNTITGLCAGTYTVTSTSKCYGIATTTFTITANVSAVTSNQNQSICTGDSLIVGTSVYYTSGTFIDTLLSYAGCDSIVTTNLTVGNNVTISQSSTICSNENYTLPGGAVVTTAGTYYDTLVGTSGCDSIITTTLTVNPIPNAGTSANVTIDPGQNTILTASGGGSYKWFPTTGLNATTSASVIASPTQTTTYCVEVTDSSGCKDTACVTVAIKALCPNNENLQVPNAFSPNGDYVNDEFCLQGWDACIQDFNIRIFNRWGEKVYESKDPHFCWQGLNRGVALDAQVFVYYIRATYTNFEVPVIRKGNISLIR